MCKKNYEKDIIKCQRRSIIWYKENNAMVKTVK